MGVERQQGGFYQPSLFEGMEENPRPDQGGEARSLSARSEEPQAFAASDPARALSVNLMGEGTGRRRLLPRVWIARGTACVRSHAAIEA